MAEAKGLDIEKTHWYKNSKAILALIVAAAGAYIAFDKFYERLFEEDPPAAERENNFEIVLDTSQEMEESWDIDGTRTSKWKVATAALQTAVLRNVREQDNLAFRVFPGDSGRASERRLNFGQHKAMFLSSGEELPDALQGIEFRGTSEPFGAVIDAAGDFQTLQAKQDGREAKRKLIVVIGSLGSRFPLNEEEYCLDLQRHVEDAKLDIAGSTLSFVALGFPEAEQLQLTACAETARARAHFADSESEVVQILDDVLGEEPEVIVEKKPEPEGSVTRAMTPSTTPPSTTPPSTTPPSTTPLSTTPPQPLKAEAPSYPCEAWLTRQAGTVKVEVRIDEKGNVISVAVLESVHEAIDKAAVDAVKQWKFIPARLGDRPTEGIIIQALKFAWPQRNPC